ncbi:vegetative cell wall protein gp1-like isoform X3 [Parus major]|uniref:vegetative cell wall protein gp1-like isoform X3 n=2 Tax=Parus major TaxID=9157 RepID=UPI001443ABE0|nr:vegetative cell wall protein gp1-like isoform X3 [Parus major]
MGGLGGAQGGLWANGQAGPRGPQPLRRKWLLGKRGQREMVSAPQHPPCTPSTPTPGYAAPHTPALHPSNWSSPHPCTPAPFTVPTLTLCLGYPCAPPNLQPPLLGATCVPLQAGTPPTPQCHPNVPMVSPEPAGWRKAVVVTCGPVTPIRGTMGRAPQSLQCPTAMWPCLLLALALLGTVPASHPAPRQLQGVPAGETPPLYYTVVKKLRTYAKAQRYCQDVYRGQLASVHSASRNQELHKLARTYKIVISPWIGAVTSKRQAGNWESYWEDSSPWNYANWAPTQPLHIVTTCTTLSVRDGLWRSRFCLQLRPFICQY